MNTVEKWITGVTAVALLATAVTSKYTAPILGQIFGGIAGVYKSAKG